MMASVDDQEWDEALGLAWWERARLEFGKRLAVEVDGETVWYRMEDAVLTEDGRERYVFVRDDL